MEDALADNLSLEAAWARLEAARAVVDREKSAFVPEVDAFAETSIGTDQPFGGTQRVPLQVGLAAQYEVDLWGRIRAQVEAERQRVAATRADYEAAAISVSAEVARLAYGLAAARARLELLGAQLEANERMLQVMETRFRNGLARRAEVLRQERLLELTRGERIAEMAEVEVLEHQLAVLLGRPPQESVAVPEELPALPPLPATGLPLELVQRRPDLRSAFHALQAADAEVAVAVADRFPRLTLGAALEAAPTSPEALVRGWVASVAAGLVLPILDGGRRRAEVERSRAVVEQRLAEYGEAVLVAWREVEDALALEQRQAEQVRSLEAQVELAGNGAELLRLQYQAGMEPWISVLDETTTAQRLERELVTARLREIELRIDLYRALGGAFETSRETERETEEQE